MKKALTRWASGIMVVLGCGHLTLATILSRGTIAGWPGRGLWGVVKLGTQADAQTSEAMLTKVVFWAGLGSFSVPLILLGVLLWQFAERGVEVPRAIGWVVLLWCLAGGVLLPSPFFAGAVAGGLLIAAGRKG